MPCPASVSILEDILLGETVKSSRYAKPCISPHTLYGLKENRRMNSHLLKFLIKLIQIGKNYSPGLLNANKLIYVL